MENDKLTERVNMYVRDVALEDMPVGTLTTTTVELPTTDSEDSYLYDLINPNPLDIQVGGNHYKDVKIQPVEYIHANKLGYIEGNVVKYITRYKQKNGKQDLEKIKHYIDLLIQLEYGSVN